MTIYKNLNVVMQQIVLGHHGQLDTNSLQHTANMKMESDEIKLKATIGITLGITG